MKSLYFATALVYLSLSASECDISGIPKEELLVALYEGARNRNVGMKPLSETSRAELEELLCLFEENPETGRPLHYLSLDDAKQLLKKTSYIDYLKGRSLKVNLAKETLNTYSYNNDHGKGAAEKIVAALRKNMPQRVLEQ